MGRVAALDGLFPKLITAPEGFAPRLTVRR